MLPGCRVRRTFWKGKVGESICFRAASLSGLLEKADTVNKQDLTETERKKIGKEKANLNKSV